MYRVIVSGKNLSTETSLQVAEQLKASMTENIYGYLLQCPTSINPEQCLALGKQFNCDINVLPKDFEPTQVKLVISDMDSTLISIECIDEIADFAGKKPQVAAVTEAAMRGELDFNQSLTQRVGLLKGLSTDVLQKVYDERLQLNPGAEEMLHGLKQSGIRFALVSGGFTFFTQRLQERLQLDFTLANELGIQSNMLSGEVSSEIVNGERKKQYLLQLIDELGITPAQTVAIGDGANDLPMLSCAGLGIAYHAKPKVQQQATCTINYGGLETVLALLMQ